MRWLFLVLVLAGCAATPPSTKPPTIPIAHQLDARGVQLLDRPQRIDFGRTDHSAERAMVKILASEPVQRGICGSSGQFVAWRDGTVLVFEAGDFRGWARGEAKAGLACV